jgi:hypothetical protein
MRMNLLTVRECAHATSAGRSIRKLHDGCGLYLWVHDDGRKYWRLRYYLDGKEKPLSLGVFPEVGLKEARASGARRTAGCSASSSIPRPRARRSSANGCSPPPIPFEAVAREWYGCQAYSLAGRSRMGGDPKFQEDKRHFLYREYLKIIVDHKPPVFVMENVKGLLSASVKDEPVIQKIIRDLTLPKSAVGSDNSTSGPLIKSNLEC